MLEYVYLYKSMAYDGFASGGLRGQAARSIGAVLWTVMRLEAAK